MAAVPQISADLRYKINIVVQPWYRDHCFAGRMILPGVETLIILAHEVNKIKPEYNIKQMFKARFDKTLDLNPDKPSQTAIIEINENNKSISAKLLTKSRTKTISRLKEHGRVSFAAGGTDSYPARMADYPPQEPGLTIPASKIYQELVPFGRAYQNIIADLRLTKRGAWARLRAPDLPTSEKITKLTGSPFPLDAALHAACVWGQRFGGFIPFPTGFSSRTIINNTEPGKTYETRVIPIAVKPQEIIFDLWIFDRRGELFESVSAMRMRDISGGRMKPPAWIIADQFI